MSPKKPFSSSKGPQIMNEKPLLPKADAGRPGVDGGRIEIRENVNVHEKILVLNDPAFQLTDKQLELMNQLNALNDSLLGPQALLDNAGRFTRPAFPSAPVERRTRTPNYGTGGS
jgi:hypothetical protein